MQTWSVFDVIGPVMVGPSSSHTAGACFIGLMARSIFGQEAKKITIKLHGSFGEVFNGHCTDKAILAGLLDMPPYDKRLPESMEIAKEKKIEVEFISCNLGADLHPNTTLIEMEKDNCMLSIQGASVGGGKCQITAIDKIPTHFGTERSTMVIKYSTEKEILPEILELIQKNKLNLAEIDTPSYKDRKIAVLQIHEYFDQKTLEDIKNIPQVLFAGYCNHFSHYNQNY